MSSCTVLCLDLEGDDEDEGHETAEELGPDHDHDPIGEAAVADKAPALCNHTPDDPSCNDAAHLCALHVVRYNLIPPRFLLTPPAPPFLSFLNSWSNAHSARIVKQTPFAP